MGLFRDAEHRARFQVKRIHVKPGAQALDAECTITAPSTGWWCSGTARVSIGGAEQLVRENESIYIPAAQWHRLENPGKMPLELIEVQIGSYLGEDDIVRSEDVYNRAPNETA